MHMLFAAYTQGYCIIDSVRSIMHWVKLRISLFVYLELFIRVFKAANKIIL